MANMTLSSTAFAACRRLLFCAAVLASVLEPRGYAAPSAALTRDETRLLLETLKTAPDHGLPAPDLTSLNHDLASNRSEIRERAEDQLIENILAYASAQHGHRIAPAAINANWALRPTNFDEARDFAAARADGRLRDWLADLPPADARYAALVDAGRRYEGFIAAGGWTIVNASLLRPGDKGSEVAALRARLIVEGYRAQPAADAETFDAPLVAALTAFQAAHGLAADGVLGESTRTALNVSAQDRLAQIDLNLERWRWLPQTLPAQRIEVNIPSADLVLFDQDKPLLTMSVVVGKAETPTPSFATHVEAVIFNPPWVVPTSIATREIIPAAERDPGYMERFGYRRVGAQIVQDPGPKNALGRIKFDIPNPFSVYLHDTPAQSVFMRAIRAASHGCVRLKDPRALAAFLLAPQGWTRESIDATIDAGETVRAPVERKTPVFILYQTAFVNASGTLHFAPDIYGWDAQLSRALIAPAPVNAVSALACPPPGA